MSAAEESDSNFPNISGRRYADRNINHHVGGNRPACRVRFQHSSRGRRRQRIAIGRARRARWQAGLRSPGQRPMRGPGRLRPGPIDWPEQKVTIVHEDVSPLAKITYETSKTVKLMVVSVPSLPAGQEVQAVVTYEVKRCPILPPKNTSIYGWPIPRSLPSPCGRGWPQPADRNEAPKIIAACPPIGVDKEQAWDMVPRDLRFVHEQIDYAKGPVKGAMAD